MGLWNFIVVGLNPADVPFDGNSIENDSPGHGILQTFISSSDCNGIISWARDLQFKSYQDVHG